MSPKKRPPKKPRRPAWRIPLVVTDTFVAAVVTDRGPASVDQVEHVRSSLQWSEKVRRLAAEVAALRTVERQRRTKSGRPQKLTPERYLQCLTALERDAMLPPSRRQRRAVMANRLGVDETTIRRFWKRHPALAPPLGSSGPSAGTRKWGQK